MGHISSEDIAKIAHLARIELTDEEIGRFGGQLDSILEYIDKLSEVDIEGVEPFLSASVTDNVFRDDVVTGHLERDAALQNAPEQGDGFFKVPQVTGD